MCFLFALLKSENIFLHDTYTYVKDIFCSMGAGPGYPYKLAGKNISAQNFKTVLKNSVFISNTDFLCLNENAKEILSQKHSFFTPALKVSGNKILIYDTLGKSFCCGTLSEMGGKKKLEHNIFAGNISKSGAYAFVSQLSGPWSKLEVFKSGSDTPFFDYLFSECCITDISLNKSGKKCACVGISANAGEMVSTVFVFDYKKDTAPLRIDFEASMAFKVEFIDEKNLVFVADNMLSIVDTSKGTKTDFSFNEKTLTSYCINDGKILLSLAVSEDGDNCEVLLFNKKCALLNSFKTSLKITSLGLKFSKIAVLSNGNVYIYNNKGTLIKTLECSKDAKKIEFLSAKYLYVLGLAEIKKIKI